VASHPGAQAGGRWGPGEGKGSGFATYPESPLRTTSSSRTPERLVCSTFRQSTQTCHRASRRQTIELLVRPCPIHPAGQFQTNSKRRPPQIVTVNDPRWRPYALLGTGNQHLLPRPQLPFHKNTCAVGTHVFGRCSFFKHWFILETNFYGRCPRNPFFGSASRDRHSHVRSPQKACPLSSASVIWNPNPAAFHFR